MHVTMSSSIHYLSLGVLNVVCIFGKAFSSGYRSPNMSVSLVQYACSIYKRSDVKRYRQGYI